jgi:hypothetical protein
VIRLRANAGRPACSWRDSSGIVATLWRQDGRIAPERMGRPDRRLSAGPDFVDGDGAGGGSARPDRGGGSSERAGGREHLLGMAGDLDFAPDVADLTRAVDQEGRPLDPHVFLAVHALLGPDAVGLAHVRPFVRGEDHAEPVLRDELVVALHAVLRDAHDHGARRLEGGGMFGEGLRLGGAARGVVLGVEVENHRLRPERRQRHIAAAVAGQGEIGGGLSHVRHGENLRVIALHGGF